VVAAFSLGALNVVETGLSIHGRHAGGGSAHIIGDPGKRFTVSMKSSPEQIQLGEQVELTFSIFNASSGLRQDRFQQYYQQFMHIVIVDSGLETFEHLHPRVERGSFMLQHTFPREGRYHLYLNYVPFQATEHQAAFTVLVGNPQQLERPQLPEVFATQQTVAGYRVSVVSGDLSSASFTAGSEPLTFRLERNGEPVTTIEPYLEAFGHLSMVNVDTYEFIHAHPPDTTEPRAGDTAGPEISFVPMILHGPVKPGTYRIFAEFKPDGTYIAVPLMIRVL
jgi:hypothetical protein